MSSDVVLAADSDILLLFGVAMALGLVGVLVPVIPGLLVIAVAAIGWAYWLGSAAGWTIAVLMLVILGIGTAAKYVLPGRSLKESGAPRSTLLLGAVGAVVGFFVIPVAGLLIGGLLGLWLGELRRLQDAGLAWRSTWTTVKAIGLGMLVELSAGVIAVATWLVAVLVMRS